ncbi:alpha/beta hydrolase family protein [Chryseobacterium paridis]|uniref:Alpha/beta fold hydrolase n=1 Tax=Chryseobacterium paridis TaxID=2800328 RepID=A0ABS1FVW7_9FLAO|nr:alpha/beta fold hydrolase [Chryseobacterium paridis]MBK1896581.1 alpha/beta fold hydrolase [Chryseobacterium paridis]
MEVKVTAPVNGVNLPVIILSHGHGASNFLASYRGYAPLVDYYAAQGFVIIQPTHQDSKTLALDPTGQEGALFWKSRAEDMIFILDNIEEILSIIPGLSERTDKNSVAAVGHSLGGHTVSMLAGMRVTDPVSGEVVSKEEQRIKAFVVFGAPGSGEGAAQFISEHYPVIGGTNFSEMKNDMLVVAGDRDQNPMFSDEEFWRMDAYYKSPSPKSLLTIFGGKHMLGGISGYDASETFQYDEENPELVNFVSKMTAAYIWSKLYPQNKSWENTINELAINENPKGKVDVK